eukprot:TRINITY_DN2430_c0_g1_i2.p1 TRINITY_DN2430_c0_g1~~TRINITY_DN2430_c0_g1_i2.p1  ORF type:complete len:426 (-),score=68.29 TRINITY_DN2430_c0_g1_i2:59-1336(-)
MFITMSYYNDWSQKEMLLRHASSITLREYNVRLFRNFASLAPNLHTLHLDFKDDMITILKDVAPPPLLRTVRFGDYARLPSSWLEPLRVISINFPMKEKYDFTAATSLRTLSIELASPQPRLLLNTTQLSHLELWAPEDYDCDEDYAASNNYEHGYIDKHEWQRLLGNKPSVDRVLDPDVLINVKTLKLYNMKDSLVDCAAFSWMRLSRLEIPGADAVENVTSLQSMSSLEKLQIDAYVANLDQVIEHLPALKSVHINGHSIYAMPSMKNVEELSTDRIPHAAMLQKALKGLRRLRKLKVTSIIDLNSLKGVTAPQIEELSIKLSHSEEGSTERNQRLINTLSKCFPNLLELEIEFYTGSGFVIQTSKMLRELSSFFGPMAQTTIWPHMKNFIYHNFFLLVHGNILDKPLEKIPYWPLFDLVSKN